LLTARFSPQMQNTCPVWVLNKGHHNIKDMEESLMLHQCMYSASIVDGLTELVAKAKQHVM